MPYSDEDAMNDNGKSRAGGEYSIGVAPVHAHNANVGTGRPSVHGSGAPFAEETGP
jgi:hypothetical protein